MSYYIFTEDVDGRRGYVGVRESMPQARDVADDYQGLTYIVEAWDLPTAKRKLRNRLVKGSGDLSEGYRNVKNRGTLERACPEEVSR